MTWVFNSSNFIFDFVSSQRCYMTLFQSLWCLQIQVGYKSYWNTNTTVQFELLFYHLGQRFSSAFLFLDGFYLTMKNATEESMTCNSVAVKNASDLHLSAWACTRASVYRFVGVFLFFSFEKYQFWMQHCCHTFWFCHLWCSCRIEILGFQ